MTVYLVRTNFTVGRFVSQCAVALGIADIRLTYTATVGALKLFKTAIAT